MSDLEILHKVYAATKKRAIYTEESELLTHVRQFIELLPKAKLIRVDGVTERGVADCIICYRGRFIAAELKDDIGEASKQQDNFLKEIIKSEGIAGICRNIDDLFNLLLLTH